MFPSKAPQLLHTLPPSSTPLSLSSSAFLCLRLTPLSPSSSSSHICCESEQRSAGSPEYYLKNFHSSSRLLVSPSICCPEPKGNMGFTKRARAAENAIRGYPSRFPSSPSLSKATRERRGRARPSDCCASPLTHFPHHCFYFPFQFL